MRTSNGSRRGIFTLELMSYLPSSDRDSTFLGRLSARESNLIYIIWVNKITDGKHLSYFWSMTYQGRKNLLFVKD